MNPTHIPVPITQRNSKRPPPHTSTQNQKHQPHLKKKNQVMKDLPFVRVEVHLHTHVVGYLVAEASS